MSLARVLRVSLSFPRPTSINPGMNEQSLLALADDLVQRAGEVILAIRASGFKIVTKADHSPVTEADHAAEAIIVAGLRAATPDIPVIA